MSRRQSSRFTSVAPEQQITQFLIENPLVSSILDDDAERVDKILENANIDANKHDQERQTPLHYAAFIGNPVSVC
jgi:ankyrin repeat protein